jgi:hypothetical protein
MIGQTRPLSGTGRANKQAPLHSFSLNLSEADIGLNYSTHVFLVYLYLVHPLGINKTPVWFNRCRSDKI